MIDQIELANIQAHKYSLLTLDDGLNIITGRSHSGKSSIIRGLKWCLENKPRGDKFRRDFIKKHESSTVAISFDDGAFVLREKNPHKGINLYTSSESKDPFKALRTDVPDEIKDVTRLRPENLQSQGDRYFLLSKTPGQVATELNKVVGLKIIDEKLAKVKRVVSSHSSTIKVLDSQIESTEKDLKEDKYQDIDSLFISIVKIEAEVKEHKAKEGKISSIKDTMTSIHLEQQMIEQSSGMIDIKEGLSPIKLSIKSFKKKEDIVADVLHSSDIIDLHKTSIEEASGIILLEGDLLDIKEALSRVSSLRTRLNTVKELYRNIRIERVAIKNSLQLVKENKESKSVLKSKLDYCVKCGAHKQHWRKEKS